MAKNYDIAEFNATDALDPTATRKLNHNFRRTLDLINEIQVGGVDTGAIAAFVMDTLSDRIDAINDRLDNLTPGEGGGVVISDYIECYLSNNTAAGTTASWQFVDVPINTVRTKYGDALSLETSGDNNHGIVVSMSGYYRISGWISMSQPGYAGIFVNGISVTDIVVNNTTGYEGCSLGYVIKHLDANDVIKLRVERSASNDPIIAGGMLSGLTVERMEDIGSSAGGGTILGVKGEMQSGYDDAENQSGYVSISIEETGEAMVSLDVLTIYDEIFNQTQGD